MAYLGEHEGLMVSRPMKEHIDNFMQLISIAQRNALHPRRRKVNLPPPPSNDQKASPSQQLLLVALANASNNDIRYPEGQRSMANSVVGGVNVQKTRFLQFQRSILHAGAHYKWVHIRLVMCERSKDARVEVLIEFRNDQDDQTLNSVSHHVLPTMANVHVADIFAKQSCALLEKDGFELVNDEVQPNMQHGNMTTNVAATTCPLFACASTLNLPQQKNNIQPFINVQTTLYSQQQLQQQQLSTHNQISVASQQHGLMGNLGYLDVGQESSSQNAQVSMMSGTGIDASIANCNGSSLSSIPY